MAKDDPLAHEPFRHQATMEGKVMIWHEGRLARALAGKEAARFRTRIAGADARAAQLLMARATGQFKFGNERP